MYNKKWPVIILFCVAAMLQSALYGAELLPVLVYHHIEEKITSDVSCTPQQFEAQMKALIDNGFTLINLAETRSFLAGMPCRYKKPVLITFDDGYASLYDYAFPTAIKFKIPMTIFVITARIGRKPQFAPYLSEDQIKEMYDSGLFEFGSHTHDLHTDSMRIFEAFGTTPDNPVINLMARDLRISASRLTRITGTAPISIAWPYGKHNRYTTAAARSSGFRLHFTSIHGYNEPGSNPFSIKRIPVTSRDTPESVLNKAEARTPRRFH